jgi:hypothetical protein
LGIAPNVTRAQAPVITVPPANHPSIFVIERLNTAIT